jgi:hypothetical protein
MRIQRAGGGGMSRGTIILFIWLIIGAAAAGQRGYFTSKNFGCSSGATIAVTIAAGPLNYVGVDPSIGCKLPKPST